MAAQRLSRVGERGFLRRLLPRMAAAAPGRFRVPPGDDAAVLADGTVLTIDGLTEGTHFESGWAARCRGFGFSLGRALGWKLMSANLSDLAAMGATRRRWSLIYLGAPGSLSVSFLDDFYRGLRDVGDAASCAIAGGDTVRAKDLSMAAAVGARLSGRPLTRSGASAGDLVCVAGEVGDAAAGLAVLQGRARVRSRADAALFVRRFFRPRPQLEDGARLAAERGVTAALDLSDSLLETLQLLCAASGVGASIEISEVPVSAAYRRHAGVDARVLSGGEDYGLLFTLKRARAAALRRAVRFSVIGETVPARAGLRFHLNGRAIQPPAAFRHFG